MILLLDPCVPFCCIGAWPFWIKFKAEDVEWNFDVFFGCWMDFWCDLMMLLLMKRNGYDDDATKIIDLTIEQI